MDALHKLLQVTREEKKEKDLFDDDEAQKVFLQVPSSVEVKTVIQLEPPLLLDRISVSFVENWMKICLSLKTSIADPHWN